MRIISKEIAFKIKMNEYIFKKCTGLKNGVCTAPVYFTLTTDLSIVKYKKMKRNLKFWVFFSFYSCIKSYLNLNALCTDAQTVKENCTEFITFFTYPEKELSFCHKR